jgi:hypothetical protein
VGAVDALAPLSAVAAAALSCTALLVALDFASRLQAATTVAVAITPIVRRARTRCMTAPGSRDDECEPAVYRAVRARRDAPHHA